MEGRLQPPRDHESAARLLAAAAVGAERIGTRGDCSLSFAPSTSSDVMRLQHTISSDSQSREVFTVPTPGTRSLAGSRPGLTHQGAGLGLTR
jgi:hypothetical protein